MEGGTESWGQVATHTSVCHFAFFGLGKSALLAAGERQARNS